jgi:hypothetical protein
VTPANVKQARKLSDWTLWEAAMKAEMNSMHENQVFELVDPPKGKNIVKCRWVFTLKDGIPPKYKARLVARGFSQRFGVDFEETYAPTAHYDSLRLLLSIAAANQWMISQLDVSTAFLNGELKEEIFMEQPENFVDHQYPGRVWKLKRSLYGLKQSPRIWNETISQFLISIGFKQLESDNSIFCKQEGEDISIILLYVDDLLLFSNQKQLIKWMESKLFERFKMNTISDGGKFLGFEIIRSEEDRSISINQNQFVSELLEKTDFRRISGVKTPMEPGLVLSKHENEPPMDKVDQDFMSEKPYRSIVGSLNYLACGTRPDIAFAVHNLSRHLENPRRTHWIALERVLNYLESNPEYSICYSKGQSTDNNFIHAYSDADHGGDNGDRHSISAYVFIINNGIVSWSCKAQETIALSSTEAEYVALSHCARNVLWFKSIFSELGIPFRQVIIKGDNLSSLHLAKNPILHQRTKHIDIKHHFIRQLIKNKVIDVEHVRTEDMLADPLTKSVSYPKLQRFIPDWGLQALRGRVKDKSYISPNPS